jgi:hypothetical protein
MIAFGAILLAGSLAAMGWAARRSRWRAPVWLDGPGEGQGGDL